MADQQPDIGSRPFKIIIIDDDQNIATAIRLVIRAKYPIFKVDTAADGIDGWDMISAQDKSYDLIISDWNMPRLSGEYLLQKVRRDEKVMNTPFLMLTVRRDSESVVYAVRTGVTDYVVKPFDKNLLLDKVEKLLRTHLTSAAAERKEDPPKPEVLSGQTLLERILNIIEKGDIDLPAMPQVIFKIEEKLKEPEATIDTLSSIISLDVGISAKLIGVANSIYYRGISECDIVEDAIMRLGMQETRELVHIISNRALYAMKDSRFEDIIEQIYLHAIACGSACRSIAIHLKLPDPNNYFSFGLLHDIGKVVVFHVLSLLTKDKASIDKAALLKVADRIHTKAGEMVLIRWGFPQMYAFTALNHEDISSFTKPAPELAVVYLGNIFARKIGFATGMDTGEDMEHIAGLYLQPIKKAFFDATAVEIRAYVEKVRNLI